MPEPNRTATTHSNWIRLVPVVLGFVGIAGAIALAAVRGMFLPWHYAMGGLSIVSIIIGLAWVHEARIKEMLGAFVYTGFFILCMGLLYLIAANRDQRWDLTKDRVHSLSNLTASVLRRIPTGDRISIQAFSPAAEHPVLQQFLSSYQRSNSRVTFELYDAQRDLTVVSSLGGDVKNGEIVISHWDDSGTLVRRETSNLDAGSKTRENDLTNAIARLFSSQQQVVYFTAGHGEKRLDDKPESLMKVAKELAAKGIPVKQLRLMEGAIPEDAGALVIAGPTIDLLDFERELLDQYLQNGGKIFLMIDPILQASTSLENVERLLSTVGVQAKNVFIVDPDGVNVTGLTLTPMVALGTHPITDATEKRPFVLETARELGVAQPVPDGLTQEVLLQTSLKVWSEPAENLRSTRRPIPPDDPKEIHARVVGVALEKKTGGGRYGTLMRMVVVTDSDAFTDGLVDKNGDAAAFFIQSVQWLRQQDDLLQVPPKFLTSTPIALTSSRAWLLAGFFGIVGLIITIGGTALTLRRRRMG